VELATKLATPCMEKIEAGVVVPSPTLLFPVTIKVGVEVPSSDTTNIGVVEPCSTEKVAQGVEEEIPTAERPMEPEPSEEE